MAENDDFLIQEVKAELERERLENLWKHYGTYVIALVVGLVALVGGVQYWKSASLAATEQAGAAYDEALHLASQKKYEEAAKGFEKVAETGVSGYAGLADLQLAATYLDEKKPDEALKAFEKAAKTGSDEMLRDFAKLQIVAMKLGTADFTEIQNRLNSLISDENPWRFNAREMLGLAQLRAGQTDMARDTFSALLGERKLPPAMQERVQTMMAQIIAGSAKAASAIGGSDTGSSATGGKADATAKPVGAPLEARIEAGKPDDAALKASEETAAKDGKTDQTTQSGDATGDQTGDGAADKDAGITDKSEPEMKPTTGAGDTN